MKRAEILDGKFAVYEDGTVMRIDEGREVPARLSRTGKKAKGDDRYYALYNPGDKKTYLVHRLIAEAFIPNHENKPEVNHKDSVKTHNSVDNLEWVTRRENWYHAYNAGKMKRKKRKVQSSNNSNGMSV